MSKQKREFHEKAEASTKAGYKHSAKMGKPCKYKSKGKK